MKKIVIIAIIILGIVSCKSNGDEPTPKSNTINNSYMSTLNGTTWLLVDKGDNNGSYLSDPTYIDQTINRSTLSYRDSTLTFKINGNTTSWTATYYLDSNNWLWYYYNPKRQYSVFEEFGLQYTINENIMYQTNSVGEYAKYLKQ